ncbi:hypothetical protein SUGI_0805100 [Cryptomeria japonica]|nr:hypothetical protein SUGI_0805100 [Cryptomeria japonica]
MMVTWQSSVAESRWESRAESRWIGRRWEGERFDRCILGFKMGSTQSHRSLFTCVFFSVYLVTRAAVRFCGSGTLTRA